MNWQDKGVLITGASRGLGADLMRTFAHEGARVAGLARGKETLEKVVDGLVADGLSAHGIVGDVGNIEQARAMAAEALAAVGPIDVVVHNASTLGPLPLVHLLDLGMQEAQRAVEVNLLGPLALTQALVGNMAARGEGTVLFISSDAALEGYPGWGIYGATKAAQDQLGRVLAAELKNTNIKVVAVDPGEMDTRMHADAMPDADRLTLQKTIDVARRLIFKVLPLAPKGFSRVSG